MEQTASPFEFEVITTDRGPRMICIEDTSISDLKPHIQDTSVSDLNPHIQDKYTDLNIATYVNTRDQTLMSCVPDVGSDYFSLSNNPNSLTSVSKNRPIVIYYTPDPIWHRSIIIEDPSDLEICQFTNLLPDSITKIQWTVSYYLCKRLLQCHKCVILNMKYVCVGINYTFMLGINDEITHAGLLYYYACQSLKYYYCLTIVILLCISSFSLNYSYYNHNNNIIIHYNTLSYMTLY
jgi:hypothetical protein